MTFSDFHDPSLHSSTQPCSRQSTPSILKAPFYSLPATGILIPHMYTETSPPPPLNHYVHQEDKIRLYCEISRRGVSQYSQTMSSKSAAFVMKRFWVWAPHSESLAHHFSCAVWPWKVTVPPVSQSLPFVTALITTRALWRFEELIHIKHLEQFPARNELSEPVSNYCYYCLQTVDLCCA